MSHVAVASYPTRTEAQSAARMLAAAGVDAHVVGDDAGGALPHLTFGVGGSQVHVPSSQQQEALDLLDVDMTDPDGQVADPETPRADARRRRWLRVVAAAALLVVALGAVIALIAG